MGHLLLFFNSLLMALAESAPFIVGGYLLAALIREFVPLRYLISHFGAKGLRPVLNAVGIGGFLPICSCGAVPLGIGVFKSGAGPGTTLSFLTSAPTISPAALILAYHLFEPKLVTTYLVMMILGAIAVGLIGNVLLKRTAEEGVSQPVSAEIDLKEGHDSSGEPTSKRIGKAMHWAFWDLGGQISLDLTLGLSIAAVIMAFVPQNYIQSWLGSPGLVTLISVVALAIPAYVCSVPSLPIVHQLLFAGMSPGSAVAFMIAGPATNLGELNAIRNGMGGKTVVYYTCALICLAVLAGSITDHIVYDDYQYVAREVKDQIIVEQSCCVPITTDGTHFQLEPRGLRETVASIRSWKIPFLAVLLMTLVVGLFRQCRRACLRLLGLPADGRARPSHP